MSTFKKKMKALGAYVWEFFKGSIPATLMYFCAGTVLTLLVMKEDGLTWDNGKLGWTILCIVVAVAYNAFVIYLQGGNAYDMLVTGNVKRYSYQDLENGYKMSSHKEVKEYRDWKGFVIGAFVALYTVVTAIIFGCNQKAIVSQNNGLGLGVLIFVCFLISGWSLLPIYFLNVSGANISFFLCALYGLIPIVVTGVTYIAGAYGRRNKKMREQAIQARAEQEAANKPKKINYGGLPGTKPRKRK